GATWLALAALPFFPMGGDGRRARTVGWFELRAPRDEIRPWFAWPVWRYLVDAGAIAVLLRHDIVREGARLAVESPIRRRQSAVRRAGALKPGRSVSNASLSQGVGSCREASLPASSFRGPR